MKYLKIAAVGAAILASQGQAHEEGVSIDAQIRAYLLAHPEVIMESLAVLAEREQRSQFSQKIASFPGLFQEDPVLGQGRPDAPVRVIEFFDYKCVPCKAMHPKLTELVDKQPDLRIEMRQLPILTPASERAARFALAVKDVAGDEAYRQVHKMLWAHKGPYNTVVFGQFADKAALDYATLEPVMESDAISDRIEENRDIAIALEILGTPAFITPDTVSFGQSDIGALAKEWLSQ